MNAGPSKERRTVKRTPDRQKNAGPSKQRWTVKRTPPRQRAAGVQLPSKRVPTMSRVTRL